MSVKRRQTLARVAPTSLTPPQEPRAANVLDLRMRVLPRHLEMVARWLEAGRVMGLCDAAPFRPDPERPGCPEYVLVWVRESADPAYMISAEGMHWTVTDSVRDQLLVRVRSFEEALHFIRPVLKPAAPPVRRAQRAPMVAGSRSMRVARMNSPIDHA
jgi:hypothetical protein